MKKKIQQQEASNVATDDKLRDLAKIAFANMCDFARFEPDGSVHIFDWEKAREVGAQVSVVTRKIGRGKNAREVRRTRIKMPSGKLSALIKLYNILVRPRRKRK